MWPRNAGIHVLLRCPAGCVESQLGESLHYWWQLFLHNPDKRFAQALTVEELVAAAADLGRVLCGVFWSWLNQKAATGIITRLMQPWLQNPVMFCPFCSSCGSNVINVLWRGNSWGDCSGLIHESQLCGSLRFPVLHLQNDLCAINFFFFAPICPLGPVSIVFPVLRCGPAAWEAVMWITTSGLGCQVSPFVRWNDDRSKHKSAKCPHFHVKWKL